MGEYDEPVSSLQRREQLEGGWSNSESICVPGKCWQRQMPWLPALLTILDVYVKEKWFVLFRVIRDFPGSPVVKKSCFHTGDTGSIPVGKLRSHMPCAATLPPTKNGKKVTLKTKWSFQALLKHPNKYLAIRTSRVPKMVPPHSKRSTNDGGAVSQGPHNHSPFPRSTLRKATL